MPRRSPTGCATSSCTRWRRRYDVDAVDTEAPGHATELCREAAHEGYDVVVAFGGDGTVNEAANGLVGSPTPLCALPGGSTNVYVRDARHPRTTRSTPPSTCWRWPTIWHPRKVDVGVVNGRCFAFSSGVGLDASVVARVDSNPRLKARFGPWFFTWAAVNTFTRRYLLHPPRLVARYRRRAGLEGVTAIVQNGSPFTYFLSRPIEIAQEATLGSGTLSACVLHRARPIDMPFIAWRAFSRRVQLANHRQITPFAGAHRAEHRIRRRQAAAAAGRRRLPRRGRARRLLDPPAGAERHLLID